MVFFYRKDLFEDPKVKELYRSWVSEHYEELKKILEKVGLSPKEIPKELKVPETNGEFIVISRFFTKKYNPKSPTEYGVALMAKRTHVIFYMYLNFFGPFRRSPEGLKKFGKVVPEYGEYFTEWGTPAFNSTEGIKALLIYKELTKYAPAPFAADYPDLVRTVILLAAGGKVAPQPEAQKALQTIFDPNASDEEYLAAMHYMVGDPADVEIAWAALKPSRAPQAAPLQAAAAKSTPLADWWAPPGEAPYLVLQGTHDQAAPPENGELLREEMGDRVTLIPFEGAGHLMLVTRAQEVAQAIVDFL